MTDTMLQSPAGGSRELPAGDLPHPIRGTCIPGCPQWGVCHCGCGRVTRMQRVNDYTREQLKGRPIAYARGHSPGSVAAFRASQSGLSWHSGELSVEKVRPLVEFLVERYGSYERAGQVAGLNFVTLWNIVNRVEKRGVRRRTAEKLRDAVLAHRRASDPLAIYDTEARRLPTPWERARTEGRSTLTGHYGGIDVGERSDNAEARNLREKRAS